MPYIDQTARIIVNDEVKELATQVKAATRYLEIKKPNQRAGVMNYTITRLLQEVYMPTNYANINEMLGVLEAVKLEMYRRLAAPYEDNAVRRNGDVYAEPVYYVPD